MGTTQLEASPVGTTPKFSRYRSVRRAAAEEQKQCAEEAPPAKSPSATIARSMSRYRRPKTPTATATAAANHPPVPVLPSSIQVPQPVRKSPGVDTPTVSSASEPGLSGTQNSQKPSLERLSDEEDSLSEIEKARMREDAMRKLTMAERPKTASVAPAVPQSSQSTATSTPEHKRASWKERLGLPNHKKAAADAASNQNNMDSGTHNLAPGIDAPVSAVNAGERRVLVKYRSSAIKLPVTPTTRVKDIVYSAANCFSERFDTKVAIVVESFASLGLDRPLRRYEHVRDVLNSWSADHVNALVISDSPFEGATRKLELNAAPAAQPKDAKFYLYHSSKPGKWDKRYITLRADGQVVLSKKSDAKEKDFINICHMSDFDIYTPTGRQVSKTVRPPKKICFAIKSQQKSSMFISTENFVHFFATNDSPLARNFHDAVHGWRSWYLVHVLGVGQKQAEATNANANANATLQDAASSTTHQRHVSTDSVPYQLGSFKPLVEFGRNTDPATATASEKTDSTPARDMFLRRKKARDRAPPPSSFPAHVPAIDTKNESLSPTHSDGSPFSPDSLLGRTYSQRQTAQREREAKEAEESGPFLAHGLLKTMSATSPDQLSQSMPYSNPSSRQNSRSNTIRSHHEGGLSHSRSNSVRQKGKPLVDLTPTYREAPQHVRKGHGVKVDAGVPLVEAATGLESAAGVPAIPSATTWRREATTAVNESSSASITNRRANTVKNPHHNHHHARNGYASALDAATPFMPNGLIALSSSNDTGNAQANMSIGRGVATGDRHATRPLLDLSPQSQFVEGSLLRNIERNQ
jgi:hypothetical protein